MPNRAVPGRCHRWVATETVVDEVVANGAVEATVVSPQQPPQQPQQPRRMHRPNQQQRKLLLLDPRRWHW
eukprot:jgi/Psemu1/314150/fgenesh1_kg.1435_\